MNLRWVLLGVFFFPSSFGATINISTADGIQGCSVNGGKIKVVFYSPDPLIAPFTVQALNASNSVVSYENPLGQGQVFLTGLPAGTYTVKVKDSASPANTGIKENVVVPTYSPLSVTAKITHVMTGLNSEIRKNTGKIDVTMTGGQMPQVYIWSKGPTVSGPWTQYLYLNSMGTILQPPDLTDLSPGFYRLEIFTTNYCSYFYYFEVKKIKPVSNILPLDQ